MSLAVDQLVGLSPDEAAQRLRSEGFNELPQARARSLWAIAAEVALEPMFLLLFACGSSYLLLGEPQEAAMLLGFVFVVLGITLYQQRKTERALEALRNLSSPRALVIRGGHQRRIAGREVVRDDLVVLAEGDRVPADGLLLWSSNLAVDESLLTGEPVPVRKRAAAGEPATRPPGGDDQPFVYSGTLVVQGQGIVRVVAVGGQTQLGRIGRSLESIQLADTHLESEVRRLVRRVALLGTALCAVVVITYGLRQGDWLQGLLAGLTLAMALLPEEFPVVLTIFLALGAWRLSQNQVLTRRVSAIEMLGAAGALCVDKTGTLTLNRMSVRLLSVGHELYDLGLHADEPLPERFHELVEFGILASQRDPFDPMEKAFHQLGGRYLSNTEHLHSDWTLVREYPLSPDLLALSHVWQSPAGTDYVIAAKGAPEAIADLCHLDPAVTRGLLEQVERLAAAGLRVLAVAESEFRLRELPGEQHDFAFRFLGLVGLDDPVRPGVPAAVQECYAAGIRLVMITGDHPATAESIARQIGLAAPHAAVTGLELEQLDDAALARLAGRTHVFARMLPEQKLRLVTALKSAGSIVAMTGDGVNDAPALKAAHIGIAMGGRGTDVAREAADLVLLDDDFSSIVAAVAMGRRIYTHLQQAMTYIVAVHVPIAGLSLLPALFQWPLVLMPIHILFLELVIDPACSVVFEAEPAEPGLMRRPPRDPSAALFSARMLLWGLVQGTSVLAIVLGVFLLALVRGHAAADARALSFTTLVLANLGLIFGNRSSSQPLWVTLRQPNRALWWVSAGTLALLVVALYLPPVRRLFHFSLLHPLDVLACLAAGAASLAWCELLKHWRTPPSGA